LINAASGTNTKWKQYPTYKDSGVEWLGEVPENWKAGKLWDVASVKARLGWRGLKASEYVDDGYIFLSTPNIKPKIIDFENIYHITAERYFESPEIILQEGDVLIAKDGSTLGITNVVRNLPAPATVNSSIAVIRPKKILDGIFLYYFLLSDYIQFIIQLKKDGMGVPHLFQYDLRKFSVLIPTTKEQQAISAFLDCETAKIDILIAKKERLIKLLQEKRVALISHAVTKGLDPNVPMKDSGVGWIGKVPEYWNVQPLKYICSLLRDGTHLPPPRTDIGVPGVPLLSVRNIVDGRFVNLPDDSFIAESDFWQLEKSFSAKENDIVLAIVGATLGKVAVVEKMPPFHIQRSLALFRTLPKIMIFKYLYYFFRGDAFQQLLWRSVGFSAQPGIYLGTIASIHATVPLIEEQRKIINYLDYETLEISNLIDKIHQTIEKLKEYRTALISAAVTGKIDVRNEVGGVV
jgi:type I restriction enzyme S subunit